MGLESVFRLSLIMNMIDNLTGPMAGIHNSVEQSVSRLQSAGQTFGQMAKTGAVMQSIGEGITSAVLSPVEATFATRKAIGELASLGVKDLEALENAAKQFSDTWAGTSKADFITAAYAIKSGIASLSDEGIAQYTDLSGVTAMATKSTIEEMTDLFATGYGIYKGYYDGLSDLEFGEMFSAGIATAVKDFKTSGSEMSASISRLGAAAVNANVPFEEQLTILGMLQATMSGGEAGTKYSAFLRSAARGGEALGLSFLDANNQLKSLPEIMDELRYKFGDTIDAAEKLELQQAFGDSQAIQFIDLFYNKTSELESGILNMYGSLGQGVDVTRRMAEAINGVEPSKFEVLQQRIQNVKESIGNTLLPTVNEFLERGADVITKVGSWVHENQALVSSITMVVLFLGGFLSVAGTAIAVIGGIGIVFTKAAGYARGFAGAIRRLPGLFDTIRMRGISAATSIRRGFGQIRAAGSLAVNSIKRVALSILSMAKTAAINGFTAVKSFAIGLVGMARQAVTTAVTAMPGLISAVWSFTTALLANPITWVIAGIAALIAALVLLWQHWDRVSAWIDGVWGSLCQNVQAGIDWVKSGLQGLMDFFGGIGAAIGDTFSHAEEALGRIPGFVTEKIGAFRESGRKIVDTITEGIKSAASKPVEAVRGIFARVRNLLPFSDAKEGPLSTLTLSGKRTMTTIAEGIHLASDAPANAVKQGLGKIETEEPFKKVSLREGFFSKESKEETVNEKEKGTVIQRLILNVDLRKIKDLQQLLHLVKEIEDYAISNGIGDPEPEGA